MSDESVKPATKPAEEQPKAIGINCESGNQIEEHTPSLPTVEQRPKRNGKTGCNQEKITHWEYFERFVKCIECVALIGGVATAIFIGYQWKEMRKASEDAEKTIALSQGQLDEMKQDRILDERAWVAPFEMIAENSISDTNNTVFKLRFRNTGKTPALNVSESHDIAGWVGAVPTNNPPIEICSMMLAPDGISFIGFKIDNYTVSAIKGGYSPFFVYGKISYDDIFGNHHWTEFCWGIERDLNFRPGPTHNGCDKPEKKS
jgi:hypothetical protein